MTEYADTDSSDEWDEWFDRSITRYGRLFMFDFDKPVKQLEIIDSESMCIAHAEKRQRNEIVNIALPKKLLVSKDKETTIKDSDLKMQSGGFTENPLLEIQTLYGKNILLSSERGCNGIFVYNLQAETTDIIKHEMTIHYDLLTPRITYNKINLVATVTTNKQDCFLIDTNAMFSANKVVLPKTEIEEHPIKAVFVSSNILGLCDTTNGSVQLYDIRSKSTVAQFEPGQSTQDSQWTVSSSFLSSPDINENPDDRKIGLLSTSGIISLHDTRNLQNPQNCENIQKDLSYISNAASLPITLNFSPFNSSIVSVSGFNGNVFIYNSSQSLRQEFVHDAHAKFSKPNEMSLVTDHMWYKTIVISACENLSVHCWEYAT